MTYKSRLGLSGIPRIRELRVQPGFMSFIYGALDEFIHIADTLEDWQLEKKSIVEYVQDEEHQKALIADLAKLRKNAELELNDKSDDQGPKYIRRRQSFIKIAEAEISRLQGWKSVQVEERAIPFREFNVTVVCAFSDQDARKVAIGAKITFFEEGDFTVGQEMIESGEIDTVPWKVTNKELGECKRVTFTEFGPSRLFLYEEKTKRKESKLL